MLRGECKESRENLLELNFSRATEICGGERSGARKRLLDWNEEERKFKSGAERNCQKMKLNLKNSRPRILVSTLPDLIMSQVEPYYFMFFRSFI